MAPNPPPAKVAHKSPPNGRWSRLRAALASLSFAEPTILLLHAGLVGLAAGLGAVGFIALLKLSSWFFLVELKSRLGITRGLSLLLLPLLPALGGLLVAPLILFFPAEAKGTGMPEVIESAVMRGGVLRPRTILLRAVASAISIGSGGSAGREGPIAQMGAAIGSTVGQLFKMSRSRLRLLVGCGTAAGIAATFNAPLAGVLFSQEIILGEFALRNLSPLLVASVVATIVSRATLGPTPAFDIPAYSLVSPWELPIYLGLGLLCGLAARGFARFLYTVEDWFEGALPRIPTILKPALGGFAVGIAAIFMPQLLGNGYQAVGEALRGELPFYLLALLILFKMGATSATLGSGGSGGVIAPSLFVGAMVGGAVGALVHALAPSITATKGAYAVVGMGALMAAATHSPLTNIVLLFELTDGYSLILPAAVACIASYGMAQRMDADSIYTWKLTRRGVNVARGREVSILGSLFVRDVMTTPVDVIPEAMSWREIRRLMDHSTAFDFPVVDEQGRLTGTLSLQDLSAYSFEPEAQDTVVAKDLASAPSATLRPSDTLQAALEAIDAADRDQLPVVADDDSRRIVGMLHRRDLLSAYERAVIARSVLK